MVTNVPFVYLFYPLSQFNIMTKHYDLSCRSMSSLDLSNRKNHVILEFLK